MAVRPRWQNGRMRLLAPLWTPATYRGWIWVILGGALLMPYMMLGGLVYNSFQPSDGLTGVTHPLVFLGVLPLVAVSSLLLPDLEVERTAARRLLGADFESPAEDGSWNARWRTGTWFTVHVAVGGVLSGLTLSMIPFVVYLMVAGVIGSDSGNMLPESWPVQWGLLIGPAILLVVVWAIVGTCRGMRRLAPRLLGPSAEDRLVASRAETARLAARNRIARELHDSVGHALSVVVVQSEAASRVVESDPRFAAQAMAAVGDTARSALSELDTVIGALREDREPGRAPQPGLDDLEALAVESGVEAELRVDGGLAAVRGLASRESYRIVQEALTNVLRHADRPCATITVDIAEDLARITVDSPASRSGRSRRGGRGLIGMRERAAVLGGTVEAGREGDRWIVRATIPLEETTDGTTERPTDDGAAAHSTDR